MKKILLFLVTILLPMVASAYDFEANGFYFKILSMEDLTVEITSGDNNYEGDIVIPPSATFAGKELRVIKVGDNAFRNCQNVTSVTFSNNITTIGDYAFSGCGIKDLTILGSIIYIGGKSFFECHNLKNLIILDDEKDIEINWKNYIDRPFTGCPIEYIYIGRNIKRESWGSAGSVFWGLTSDNLNVEIGENVDRITYWQFKGCKISSIVIPNSVREIMSEAFAECTLLEEVQMSENVQVISHSAFNGCSSLTSIVIPKSVVTMGDNAFANCSKLLNVKTKSPIPLSISDNCFTAATYWTGQLTVPYTTSSAYKNANGWNNFSHIVEDNTDVPSYCLFYILDGVEYRCFEIKYGATITPEPDPTKEGYTFSGWSEIPETMPAHDVTVTGSFTINKYKLAYTVDGEEYKSYDVEYGGAITPEPAPTKEGYTFSGWSEIPEMMPAHDVTITGTFAVNKYKLIYKVDGAEYKTYELEYGTAITPESRPTKEGYTFSGWSEIPKTMPAHNVTVTGTFTINMYKLTYIVDGQTYKTYDVEYGAAITPEAEPTKEGYTFSGWSETPETMPAHDVTVTGSFHVNSYKLTYMIDDKVYKESMYEYGATITPEPQPEGDYATFEWKDMPQTMPAHDVVVYASYTSGIIEVLMTTQRNIRIYSPNGKKQDKLQKGLNIVVLDDGTVKKVVVK